MKTLLLTTFFVTQLIGHGIAGTSILPEIPAPKLTSPEVLAIVQKQMHDFTNYTVVGINWSKSSDFQPGLGDYHYSPGPDHPGDYSWFVTYLYKDDATDRHLQEIHVKRQFNEVSVIRVKDDGQIGFFVGAR